MQQQKRNTFSQQIKYQKKRDTRQKVAEVIYNLEKKERKNQQGK